MQWNANTGRSTALADKPLPPCAVSSEVGGIQLTLSGNVLSAHWECKDRNNLIGVLGALHFVLPISLGIEFLDPIIVTVTSGRAGAASFVWQVAGTSAPVEVVDVANRDDRCLAAINRLQMLSDPDNSRLLAAAAYLQKAHRLMDVGVGPSEFASEAVVNLAKTLEVLFPAPPDATRTAVRSGLSTLGYDPAEVERFVSCLVLRSQLDAAHVRMATLTTSERQKLQAFMEAVRQNFRELINRVIGGVHDGTFTVPDYQMDRSEDDDLSKMIERL